MMRWLRIGFWTVVIFAAFTYAADWIIFKLDGSPTSKFTVSHFVSAPLKNNKEEIDYVGSDMVPCSISLFPQGGYTPCWYLRRHTNDVSRY